MTERDSRGYLKWRKYLLLLLRDYMGVVGV